MTSHYLPPSLSDHSPILFECCAGTSGGGRPFRFLNVLAGHAQFHESVTVGCFCFRIAYAETVEQVEEGEG